MNIRTACFTGHRSIPNSELQQLKDLLKKTIEGLVDQGVIYYGFGGALGFDTLAAQAVIKQRKINPLVKLIAVLPCRNQDVYWNESDKQIYHDLLTSADKITYTAENYYNGCMAKRNLHLVENSRICVAYMKHRHTGTAQTIKFARERGLTIINLAEFLLI